MKAKTVIVISLIFLVCVSVFSRETEYDKIAREINEREERLKESDHILEILTHDSNMENSDVMSGFLDPGYKQIRLFVKKQKMWSLTMGVSGLTFLTMSPFLSGGGVILIADKWQINNSGGLSGVAGAAFSMATYAMGVLGIAALFHGMLVSVGLPLCVVSFKRFGYSNNLYSNRKFKASISIRVTRVDCAVSVSL